MKNKIVHFVIFVVLISAPQLLLAQKLNIQIIEDNPEKAYTNFVAIDLLGADFDFNFRAPGVYAGINGRWDVTSNLTLEGLLRPSYSLYGEKSLGIATEANVFYPFASKKKVDDIKVITGFSQSSDMFTRTSTTNYFMTEGHVLRKYGARGGVYYKQAGMQSDEAIPKETFITHSGVFVGLQQTIQAMLHTRVNNEYDRHGAGFTRVYADFLLLPGSKIDNEQVNDSYENPKGFGYRLGIQYYLNPYSGDYKLWGASLLNAEIGTLPYTGFYVTVGYAVVILNRK